MTLIIGVQCADGVVVGADGAATLGALGMHTARQTGRKLTIIRECVVVGVSGPIGLGQRIKDEFQKLWDGNKLSGKNPVEAGVEIRKALFPHIQSEMAAAQVAQQTIGQVAHLSAITATVAAFPAKGNPCLIQFDQQGAPEVVDDVPFVAIGSGQAIADPFFAFLRRIIWKGELPSISGGIRSVAWTLHHAIETNPGGVSEPKQIIVLRKEGKGCRAQELADKDIQDHLQAISGAEAALASYLEGLEAPATPDNTSTPPKP